jgi:CHAD domain-containing protein
MFKESLFGFYSAQVSKIGDAAITPLNTDNQEIIHSVRIGLKKIKTIVMFLENLKIPDFTVNKLLKKEDSLFEILGKIREINKQYDLIMEYEHRLSSTFKEYLVYLKKKEKKLIQAVMKSDLVNIFDHLKKIQLDILGIIDMYEDAYLYDEALLYILSEFEKIESVRNGLNDHRNWHFVRKCLKNIMYTCSIIIDSHCVSEITGAFYKDIDNLQEKIGYWHDDIVSFELLSQFVKKNLVEKTRFQSKYQKLLYNLI